MIVIRDAQMKALQATRDGDFVAWAAGHLRRACPAEVAGLGEAELRRRCLVGLGRARRAGFAASDRAAEFLVLMVRYAPNFDDHPDVQRALHRDVLPELCLLTLPVAVSAAIWDDVRARRDDRVWEGEA